jgi:MEKHLA domain
MIQNAPWQTEAMIVHCQNLAFSYHHWTKLDLLSMPTDPPPNSAWLMAERLFYAPFALLSHGLEADPILNYGNQTALNLWQTSWAQLTTTPSRQTAEPQAQSVRGELLAQALAKGFIQNYQGIRISSKGNRFAIANVTIWNLIDYRPEYSGQKLGQAAMFTDWQMLD